MVVGAWRQHLLTCLTEDCQFKGRVFVYRPERVGTWAYRAETILCVGCNCELIDRENPPANVEVPEPEQPKSLGEQLNEARKAKAKAKVE